MKLQVFQHVAFEGPARIADWANDRRHEVRTTKFFAGETAPEARDYDVLVIMGGPMGAQDDVRHPWLKAEKKAIADAITKKKKVLGVCLGAQLIARALGAKVYANPEKEIGWHPIELNPPNVRHHPLNVLPQRVTVFHWHGDTFDLPPNAKHLARSQACENQAFSVGDDVVGLQFHIEMAAPQIETLLRYGAADLARGPFVQQPDEILDLIPSKVPPLNAALFRFLDGFTA